MNKNILIVGAFPGNRGSQSMLFIAVDEIKKRIKEAKIYFAGTETDVDMYAFEQIFYSESAKDIALSECYPFTKILKCVIRDLIKFIIGRRDNLWKYMELKKKISTIDFIIDVSGYSLGNKWSESIQLSYLKNIQLAKKYNIPIVLMPQSFGPFLYDKKRLYLMEEIKSDLQYPTLIYAREEEGYNLLKAMHLDNVRMSTDLVLQNKSIDIKNIYKGNVELCYSKIRTRNPVGIVPNMQCFNHGDNTLNIQMYIKITQYLLSIGKQVYIFHHSKEDKELCRKLFNQIYNVVRSDKIYLIEDEMSCLEYDVFVKQFEFIICSRYHGVVHAYRNDIPCIVLGWAVKYKELAKNVGQEMYAFDIAKEGFKIEDIISSIKKISANLMEEKKNIEKHIIEIQKNDCFVFLDMV